MISSVSGGVNSRSCMKRSHVRIVVFVVPYYMKFWRHVNLAILKNPYLATL